MTSFAMVMFLGAMASAVFFDWPIQGILISAVLWLIFVVGDLERSINRAHNLIADMKEDLAKGAIEEVDGVPLGRFEEIQPVTKESPAAPTIRAYRLGRRLRDSIKR